MVCAICRKAVKDHLHKGCNDFQQPATPPPYNISLLLYNSVHLAFKEITHVVGNVHHNGNIYTVVL